MKEVNIVTPNSWWMETWMETSCHAIGYESKRCSFVHEEIDGLNEKSRDRFHGAAIFQGSLRTFEEPVAFASFSLLLLHQYFKRTSRIRKIYISCIIALRWWILCVFHIIFVHLHTHDWIVNYYTYICKYKICLL